jgi:uncharacterized membrane protein YcjF (UPF0283 family)
MQNPFSLIYKTIEMKITALRLKMIRQERLVLAALLGTKVLVLMMLALVLMWIKLHNFEFSEWILYVAYGVTLLGILAIASIWILEVKTLRSSINEARKNKI